MVNYNRLTILDKRLKDFKLRSQNLVHKGALERLNLELKSKGLIFKPHTWIGDEWFSPDGVTGFAIPFYLFSRDLLEIEKNVIGYAEGETLSEFYQLIRHECAHAIDHAFFFKDDRDWINIFGNYNKPYPQSYTFKKYSKNFVRHLPDGYAQSHPEEDWAETFAVWLDPNSDWRNLYKNWSCIKKLNYLDSLMGKFQFKRQNIVLNKEIDPVHENEITLAEYLSNKKKHYKLKKKPSVKHLEHVAHKSHHGEELYDLLRCYESQLAKKLSKELNTTQYQLKSILSDLKKLARQENLKVNKRMTAWKSTSKILEECTLIHYQKMMKAKSHRVIM